jgi:hypothetical protein
LLHQLSIDCAIRWSVKRNAFCGMHCPALPGMFKRPVQPS